MKNILVYGGMLFSIIGMTSFDNILVLKYVFLLSAIILIVIGLRIKSEETNWKEMDSKKNLIKLILAGLAFMVAGVITGYFLATTL